MPLMLVIADDLTGAADCGVACAAHGLHTLVAFSDTGKDVPAEALSLDANTRHLPPHQAAHETARLLKKFLRDPNTLLYKKIDSTLRGNIGAELAAALEHCRSLAAPHDRIVVLLAPAFPAAGRTTINGHQLVHGKPLGESGISQDKSIAGLLHEAGLRPALINLDQIRSGGANLRASLQAKSTEADVLICDAETDADLRAIADAAMALNRVAVWAGSAGLAWHLLPAAGFARTPAPSQPQPQSTRPTLFVIGSGSPVACEQTERLAAHSDTMVMRIPVEVLLTGDQSPQFLTYILELEKTLRSGLDAAIMPDPEVRVDPVLAQQLTAALASMVQPIAAIVGALVVTGGETARAVFEAWGVNRLRLIGEVEPGLPYSVTSGWSRELPVLTKAGAFGSPETLLNCLHFLRKLDSATLAHSTQSNSAPLT